MSLEAKIYKIHSSRRWLQKFKMGNQQNWDRFIWRNLWMMSLKTWNKRIIKHQWIIQESSTTFWIGNKSIKIVIMKMKNWINLWLSKAIYSKLEKESLVEKNSRLININDKVFKMNKIIECKIEIILLI